MINPFDTLIDSFVDDKIGITQNFLTKQLSLNLIENLNALYAGKHLQSAGTGSGTVDHNKLFRRDKIYWLDRKHNNVYENEFLDIIATFVQHLNETCYTAITGYEFHYALYETGSFYKKHLDQFKNNDSRQYSLIVYLNEGWLQGDGGELCVHHVDRLQKISPENGKTVFFKSSELEHEVLIANKPRLSITGWLKSN